MLAGSGTDKESKYHLYLVRAKKCKANKNLHKKTNDYIIRKDSSHAYAERLGLIKWYGAFRQYVFYPDEGTVWSSGCLKIVDDFMQKANKRHRQKLRREHEMSRL